MTRSRFISTVWFMSTLGLPILVYLGIMLVNYELLAVSEVCLPYDPLTGIFLSLLAGIPFATVITILSSFNILALPHAFKAWILMVIVFYLGVAAVIISQAGTC